MKHNIIICTGNKKPWYCYIKTAPTVEEIIERVKNCGGGYPDYCVHIGNGPSGPIVLGNFMFPARFE